MSCKCFYCDLIHPKIEASGIWYCPNALCEGPGGAYFRSTLDSYQELEDEFGHTVDEDEYLTKGRAYNKEHGIDRQDFKCRPAPNKTKALEKPHTALTSGWAQLAPERHTQA
jgi:hypothetical protein